MLRNPNADPPFHSHPLLEAGDEMRVPQLRGYSVQFLTGSKLGHVAVAKPDGSVAFSGNMNQRLTMSKDVDAVRILFATGLLKQVTFDRQRLSNENVKDMLAQTSIPFQDRQPAVFVFAASTLTGAGVFFSAAVLKTRREGTRLKEMEAHCQSRPGRVHSLDPDEFEAIFQDVRSFFLQSLYPRG